MNDLGGRVALVTGAASGIGLGISRSLAARGVRVVMADIEKETLHQSAALLQSEGGLTQPVVLDVSDRAAMYAAAKELWNQWGRLDILVNNAGVAYNARPLHEVPDEAIDWSIGVNILGVLNGIKAFVPLIIRAGEGGHVVNTSSIGGFQVRKSELWHQGLYAATKFAVTALSEGLRNDLEDHGIGVSILAPAAVATRIGTSDRNRPQRFGGPTNDSQRASVEELLRQTGLSADLVGERVIRAILDNETYIFTHPEVQPWLEERHANIEQAFEATRRFMAEQGEGGEGEKGRLDNRSR